MIQELQQAVQPAAPDNWPEALATVIIAILSWWTGKRREKRKR